MCLAAVAGLCHAGSYAIEFAPDGATALVSVKVETASKAFRMPAWVPGDYQVFNYGGVVVEPVFKLGEEEAPATKGSDPNLWTIPGGADSVSYRVKPSRGNFSDNYWAGPGEVFVNGGGVFGWFSGDEGKSQTLVVKPQSESQRFESAMVWKKLPDGSFECSAKDYDVLIDSPLVLSDHLMTVHFEAEGVPHVIAAYGRNTGAEIKELSEIAAKAVSQAKAIFGSVPYKKYVFFCHYGGFAAGLEHLNSTRLGLWSTRADQAVGLVFHEYFHAFNVKRIRSEVLGPFDYTKPAVTGSLWWLEGTTDYYADLMAYRAGLNSKEGFFNEMANTFVALGRRPMGTVSADDASRKVWETRGSSGYGGLSYYTAGKGIGMILDLAIRSESQNRRSLDDVMRSLYKECDGPKGFAEGRIRELCVSFGVEKLGQIYDEAVFGKGEMPIAEVVRAAGLQFVERRFLLNALASEPEKAVARAYPGALGRS